MRHNILEATPLTVFLTAILWCTHYQPPTPATDSVVILHNEFCHGSGAIIGSHEILTARHIADQPDLRVLRSDGSEMPVCRVVFDLNSDLARVYTDGPLGAAPLQIYRAPLRQGDRVTLIGSPRSIGMMNCVLPGYVVKVDYATTVNTDVDKSVDYVNLDILDCHGGPGTSGGPVLDSSGRIRAVLVISMSGYVAAVPVGELDP
jgi:S1-C subfamily serine protease